MITLTTFQDVVIVFALFSPIIVAVGLPMLIALSDCVTEMIHEHKARRIERHKAERESKSNLNKNPVSWSPGWGVPPKAIVSNDLDSAFAKRETEGHVMETHDFKRFE